MSLQLPWIETAVKGADLGVTWCNSPQSLFARPLLQAHSIAGQGFVYDGRKVSEKLGNIKSVLIRGTGILYIL